MLEWIVTALLLIGAIFMVLAAIGLVRMPDVFMRMQTNTKSATLGVGCVFLAVALHFGDLSVSARAFSVVLFTFLTAPVAAHALGRAAYIADQPLWEKTVIDELRGQYDRQTHRLKSRAEDTEPHDRSTDS
jgi:multicomponent Na+:H+ antiporter subunit G